MSDPRVAYISSLTEVTSWQEMLLLAQAYLKIFSFVTFLSYLI